MEQNSSVIGALKKVPFFQDLSPTQVKQLVDICRRQVYEPGTSLCKTGDVSDRMFILLSGTVEIRTENGVPLMRETAITTIGETGTLTGEPRSATVVAETPVAALVISRWFLLDLMQNDLALASRVYRNVMGGLRRKLIAANRRIDDLLRESGKTAEKVE